ncbi:MAG: glycosyltransferase [Bacteroidota bacterium]
MKILAVLMKYDYGIETRGYSFEYNNVYMPLSDVFGSENVLLFDFMHEIKVLGRDGMNKKLLETVRTEKPDAAVFCLFEDEFDPATVEQLKEYTATAAYFFDDPWRQKYVRQWIPHFSYFSTPDYYMYLQYKSEGISNVVYSPFGFNTKVYVKKDLPVKYDVSFVGGYSPLRGWTVHMLERSGIHVHVFGRGWGGKNSWVSQDEVIDIINQSKINLNLSNGISYDANFLLYSLRSPQAIKDILLLKKHREQVKGRHFEINGCGGFQLSYYVQSLNTVYEIDREIAVFDNIYTLADTIRYFLRDDALRSSIASAGYERSQKFHSAQGYISNLITSITNTTEL